MLCDSGQRPALKPQLALVAIAPDRGRNHWGPDMASRAGWCTDAGKLADAKEILDKSTDYKPLDSKLSIARQSPPNMVYGWFCVHKIAGAQHSEIVFRVFTAPRYQLLQPPTPNLSKER